MSHDDFNRGRLGLPGNGSEDFQHGRQEQQRRQDEARRKNEERQRRDSQALPIVQNTSASGSGSTTQSGSVTAAGAALPETLASMAKGGASLFAVLFVLWTLSYGAWSWPSIIGGACAAAIAGLVAGALLYVAIPVLKVVLKVAAAVMVVGIALQLFVGIDFIGVLRRMAHASGL